MRTHLSLCVVLIFTGACSSAPSKNNGDTNNGASNNGVVNNGASNNGGGSNNGANNGMGSNNGASNNGASNNGGTNNGTTSREIWAADYDQTCVYDGDCEVVHEGDACLCGGSACGNAGIAAGEVERWLADREAACPPDQQMCSAAPCQVVLPVCRGGSCDARDPVYIDASTWDTSCVMDSDCVIVHEGEVCSDCVCNGTAVNASEYSKYGDAVAAADCNPGPNFCDCVAFDKAWCDGGTCAPGENPACVGMDSDGFFDSCDNCLDPTNCDTITTNAGSRSACGCSSSADCPCGLQCGNYEIAPGIVVGGVCVR